jgi:mRNA interferase MazF
MAYNGPVHQWDTFVADLEYPVGSEQGGARRPVIVVSNDGFNAAFPVVTVIPLTKREGKKRRVYPFEVAIPAKLAGNPVASIAMPYQIRTIDKTRLLQPLGRVADSAVRRSIEDRIIEHLGIAFDDTTGDDE